MGEDNEAVWGEMDSINVRLCKRISEIEDQATRLKNEVQDLRGDVLDLRREVRERG